MADSCSLTNSFVFSLSLFLCAHRFFLKFFLKCNQNCLKNAGNPRDMRRFQVRRSCRQAFQQPMYHRRGLPATVFRACFAKRQTCKSILQLKTNKVFAGSLSRKCSPCRERAQCALTCPKDKYNFHPVRNIRSVFTRKI